MYVPFKLNMKNSIYPVRTLALGKKKLRDNIYQNILDPSMNSTVLYSTTIRNMVNNTAKKNN